MDNKEKDKTYIFAGFTKTMLNFALLIAAVYIFMSYILKYEKELPFFLILIVFILREFSQVGMVSIAIGAILNHTDIERRYQKMEEVLSNAIEKIDMKLDYLRYPESIPYDKIDKDKLDIVLEKVCEQKIDSLRSLKEHELYESYFRCLSKAYVGEISKLEKGYLNKEFWREIVITPNNEEKKLRIESTITVKMYIPFEENVKKKTYTYSPRFRTRVEADSLQIQTCTLNGVRMDTGVCVKETESSTFPYIGEKVIEFEYGQDNTLSLLASYDFDLRQVPEFQEVYRVSDACSNYKFVCKIEGEEADMWDYDISDSEVRYDKASSLNRNEDKANHSCEIKTIKNRWVLCGTTFNLVIRRVDAQNV